MWSKLEEMGEILTIFTAQTCCKCDVAAPDVARRTNFDVEGESSPTDGAGRSPRCGKPLPFTRLNISTKM